MGKATEEDGAGDKDMTECDEFSCRLVLPRHRGYLAKLRLGDGITINLDRQVFAQIEEGMREALKNKEGKSRISTADRKIANAVIRKASKKQKGKRNLQSLKRLRRNWTKRRRKTCQSQRRMSQTPACQCYRRKLQEKTEWRKEKSLEVPWRRRKWTCHWNWTRKVRQRQDTDSPWSLHQENQQPP